MRTSPLRKPDEHLERTEDRTDAFAQELTELSRKHGIGIAGQATLFVMEDEDHRLSYEVDEESNLRFKAT